MLDRLAAAAAIGDSMSPADTATIAIAMRSALSGDRSWLQIDPATRAAWREREMRALAQRLWLADESRRGFARRLHRRLCLYRASTSCASDAAGTTWPSGERWFLFRMLQATGGHVPSVTTLRGLLPSAGQRRALSSGHGSASQSQDDANQPDQRC